MRSLMLVPGELVGGRRQSLRALVVDCLAPLGLALLEGPLIETRTANCEWQGYLVVSVGS